MEFMSRDVAMKGQYRAFTTKKHRDPKSHHLPKRAHIMTIGSKLEVLLKSVDFPLVAEHPTSYSE